MDRLPENPDSPRGLRGPVRFVIWVVAVLLACALVGGVRDAMAYTRECSDTGVWDPDVCERVEAAVDELAALRTVQESYSADHADERQMLGWLVGVTLVGVSTPILIRVFRGFS